MYHVRGYLLQKILLDFAHRSVRTDGGRFSKVVTADARRVNAIVVFPLWHLGDAISENSRCTADEYFQQTHK